MSIPNVFNLTCAISSQIPNPLFDLAGITCGHCLVPFWTFFGATLIGKAIIKMHIQVSIAFSIVLFRLFISVFNRVWDVKDTTLESSQSHDSVAKGILP